MLLEFKRILPALAALVVVIVWMALGSAQTALARPPTASRPATEAAGQTVQGVAGPAQAAEKITLWQAAVLGVVEGLTEYLPVSSTGHLILASHAMGLTHFSNEYGPLGRKIVKTPATDAFEIVIQLGAVLAVLGLYRKRVGQMLGGLGAWASARFAQEFTGMSDRHRRGLRLVGLLAAAFLPAAVVGKLYHKQIEQNLFGPMPVVYALAVGGVLMIAVEYFFWLRRRGALRVREVDQVRYWQALAIGLAQCLAMWPGTSRSMITITAALAVGLDMVAAAEFSFLLALPTLGAATLYSGWIHRGDLVQAVGPSGMAVGMLLSLVTAALAVKGFVYWLTRHGLIPFGVYRILLAGALLIYFWLSA